MELIIVILVAFASGLSVRFIGLPPLIGFLAAGFFLNAVNFTAPDGLQILADIGITLMLFMIGLKFNIRDLLKAEVWGSTILHMSFWVASFIVVIIALGIFWATKISDMPIHYIVLIGFAFSFSSTVCVMKLLEEAGELRTRHGKINIGILVMQDLFAVMFLAIIIGKAPSVYAIGLFGLYFSKPLLDKILFKCGHGELLPFMGFALALGGYALFDLLDIKGDLGALIMGMLLSDSKKSSELSKSLLNLKDLLLTSFFLLIGLEAIPTISMFWTALGITTILVVKFILFFVILIALKVRARTSFLSALILSNYSEFGLIVVAVSVKQQWLGADWLVIMALAISFSFIITNFFYKHAHVFYSAKQSWFKKFERIDVLPEDIIKVPSKTEVLVIGLGLVGKSTMYSLYQLIGNRVWGMDSDAARVAKQKSLGRQVFEGDGESGELWGKINLKETKLILITVPAIDDCINIVDQLIMAKYSGKIIAIARYEDDQEELKKIGVHHVFNYFTEAGSGFAKDSLQIIEENDQNESIRNSAN